MAKETLEATAHALVAPGKGILAADESTGTIEKRLKSIEVESTEDKRRDYREMLFTTPGLGDHISGVILFDETIRQSGKDGVPFTKVLEDAGVIPGIKVDKGAKPLAGAEGETVTEGLDGLRERLDEYREMGAKFTKWRAVITIEGEKKPSAYCIHVNAHALARYAVLSQEAGLVPIVEPEVLMDGDHTIERCYEVTEATLEAVFNELFSQRVVYEGMLLKPNMVISGKDCPQQAGPDEVADRDHPLLQERRPGGRAGDRVPLGRPVRRGGDGQPERDERQGAAPLAALLLLRTRSPGAVPEGLARRRRQRPGRPGRAGAPRAHERRRPRRQLLGRHGEGARRRLAASGTRARRSARACRGRAAPRCGAPCRSVSA